MSGAVGPSGRAPGAQRHRRTRPRAGCPAFAGRAPLRACSSVRILIRLGHLPRRGILPCNAWAPAALLQSSAAFLHLLRRAAARQAALSVGTPSRPEPVINQTMDRGCGTSRHALVATEHGGCTCTAGAGRGREFKYWVEAGGGKVWTVCCSLLISRHLQ